MDVLGVAVNGDSAGAQKPVPLQDAPAASRYRFFWRMHFWSGLITAPIVLFAAVTGLTSGSINCAVTQHGLVAIATTATLRRYVRWQVALGSATSVTFFLAVVRPGNVSIV